MRDGQPLRHPTFGRGRVHRVRKDQLRGLHAPRAARGGWGAANIVVIDPHGEYATALGDHASVRSVLGSGTHGIRVPYWALPPPISCPPSPGPQADPRPRVDSAGLVTEQRRAFAVAAKWLSLDPSAVTADTPIPFDLRSVWHQLDAENNETRVNVKDPTTAAIEEPGDPATLTPTRFSHYGPGGASPHKGPFHGTTPRFLSYCDWVCSTLA